jgi:carboxyl-terminal processing protease
MHKTIPAFLAGVLFTALGLYMGLKVWFGPYAFEAITHPTGRAWLESYSALRKHHYRNPKPDALLLGAVQGMVKGLGDPYSFYLSPAELKAHNQYKAGQFPSVGVLVRPVVQKTGGRIVRVQADTPAARAGLQAGDIIEVVDDERVEQLPALEVAAKLHGPAGSVVRLGIRRGAARLALDITRQNIAYVPIETRILSGNIAHIVIWGFLSDGTTSTLEQFQGAMQVLGAKGVEGMVLDLRDNNGGVVDLALGVADALMAEGVLLVTRDKREEIKVRKTASRQADDFGGPVVVLTNRHTGSAPEVLTAALQQSGRAKVLGEPTVGKTVAGALIKLSNGGAIQPTIFEWLTPKGKPIPATGIEPDIRVEDVRFRGETDPVLARAVEVIRQQINQ